MWISSLTFFVELDSPFTIEVNSGLYQNDYFLNFIGITFLVRTLCLTRLNFEVLLLNVQINKLLILK